MRGEGVNFTFSMTAVNGVSCDYEYVKNQLQGFLGGKQKVLTQMRIIMQRIRGELVLHYLVVVDRDFDATNNIKYMQVPMSHWRQQSKNNW